VEGDRTLDLRIANATLSQLSYHPGEAADFTAEAAPRRPASITLSFPPAGRAGARAVHPPRRLWLLQPFTLQATPAQEGPLRLAGMHRVDETRFEHLNESRFRNLARNKEVLGRIYAHLLSLDNFARPLERRSVSDA
jgi:hypothetical protein